MKKILMTVICLLTILILSMLMAELNMNFCLGMLAGAALLLLITVLVGFYIQLKQQETIDKQKLDFINQSRLMKLESKIEVTND